jgi:hypothetical protein
MSRPEVTGRKPAATADQIVARLLTMLPPLELLRVVEMEEAAHLSSASSDTLLREYPDLIVHVSRRRRGMRIAHALMLRELDTS